MSRAKRGVQWLLVLQPQCCFGPAHLSGPSAVAKEACKKAHGPAIPATHSCHQPSHQKRVYDSYRHAFDTLHKLPQVRTAEQNADFTVLLKRLVDEHGESRSHKNHSAAPALQARMATYSCFIACAPDCNQHLLCSDCCLSLFDFASSRLPCFSAAPHMHACVVHLHAIASSCWAKCCLPATASLRACLLTQSLRALSRVLWSLHCIAAAVTT